MISKQVARDLAKAAGASVRTVEGDALLEGYPQIHAVGRAAGPKQQPRLIDLTWGSEDAPKVTLVGKGVCFCVEINQCVGCDDAAVLARSSGEEPASPRHRAGVASMADDDAMIQDERAVKL